MDLPNNESIINLLATELSRDHSSFEGTREECDSIDTFIKQCPRYPAILLDLATHHSGCTTSIRTYVI